jgi:mannosidase alpha-like ER degradation enhancer 2
VGDDPELAAAVVAEFQHAWRGYMEFAAGHDDLKPLSAGHRDWHDVPLLMTPVDAFSTMALMGLDAEMAEAKELVFEQLAFDHDLFVQHFEISIRLLGGLLSAHDLDGDPRFLDLARDLATRMLPVWDSPTGMPYREVNLRTGETRGARTNPAEIGTYILEYRTLSERTGDPVFGEKADRALRALYERRSEIGLVGASIDVETGEWTDSSSHLGGGIDSYYEYLLKAHELTGEPDYLRMWATHFEAIERYYPQTVDGRLWYGVVDMNTGERLRPHYGALQCFYAGTLCLAGDLDQARRLQETNFWMWTEFGLEPEAIDYATGRILAPYYLLRPENIESAFYLHRATGDPRYRDMGREYLRSLVAHCRTEHGYAHIHDVRTMEQADAMESFFLAETLKYLYLLFAPADALDLDEFVFNTEAHPLRRRGQNPARQSGAGALPATNAGAASRRSAPGDTPNSRLNARQNAASER